MSTHLTIRPSRVLRCKDTKVSAMFMLALLCIKKSSQRGCRHASPCVAEEQRYSSGRTALFFAKNSAVLHPSCFCVPFGLLSYRTIHRPSCFSFNKVRAFTQFILLLQRTLRKKKIMKNEQPYHLLNQIAYPEDLRKLNVDQLPEVCQELRQDIIKELAFNPGHFASSLGVIELTVALHYIFDTPYDRIVWDVGHQAYGHKILTGRREVFSTNRKFKGIRPFPSPQESEYDTFTCGHASNSISVGLGMAVAAERKGEKERHIVAVIGDGAMSGGLAFEGLNNVASTPNNMLIILNDNDMAIDRSVGGMKQYLFNMTTSNRYNQLRFRLSKILFKLGILNDERRKGLIRFNNSLKSMVAQQQNIFEGMNIRYFGPINGHDVKNMARVLKDIKNLKGPKILHLHTIKGKGFKPAELDASLWHAPGRFDPDTGERHVANTEGLPPLFQDVFGETLVELAQQNKRIMGVTPAMPTGCSMNILMEKMPGRAFDVGIAEAHAVTFSGGMAKEGLQPFCNIYSSFMQRAYDNIIHDVAIQKLNVVLCLDRAGLVGEDGPTHHGVFDLAYLRPIPNLTIASPMNEHELRHLMYTAQLPDKGPFVIRYPRGRGVLTNWQCPMEEIEVGRGRKLKDGKDMAVLSIGPIGNLAQKAIARAEKEEGLSVAHYDLRFLKPLDEELLHEVGQRFGRIITLEDGVIKGGMGGAVLEFMADNNYHPTIKRIGVPDCFVEHGSIPELYRLCGMDEEGIFNLVKSE